MKLCSGAEGGETAREEGEDAEEIVACNDPAEEERKEEESLGGEGREEEGRQVAALDSPPLLPPVLLPLLALGLTWDDIESLCKEGRREKNKSENR